MFRATTSSTQYREPNSRLHYNAATPRRVQTYAVQKTNDWDFSSIFEELQKEYQTARQPVKVNFRKLVPLRVGVDRATHLFHSYPAKLLLNIPIFFLRCKQLGPIGHLRDPFCGSGTVLVEGALNGWRISGADANPLARLITRSKLTYLEPEEILEACNKICENACILTTKFSPVVKVDYWFTKAVQQDIGRITKAISCERNPHVRRFLQASLSSCIRKVSFADPRLSVPVRVKPDSKQWEKAIGANVTDQFRQMVVWNSRRVQSLQSVEPTILQGLTLSVDARGSRAEVDLKEDTDLIITSPPYVGAQKYIRSSSLSIGWLGLAPFNKLRCLERINIGREHYERNEYRDLHFPPDDLARSELERIRNINPLRAHIAANYLEEMCDALKEAARRLRRGGHLVLVSGNNTIAGEVFRTSDYLANVATSLNLCLKLELVDKIRSRGLMTKRNRTRRSYQLRTHSRLS